MLRRISSWKTSRFKTIFLKRSILIQYNLKEELETKVKQKEVIEKDLEEKEEIFNHLKTDLVCINSQPVQIQKEIDKINRNKK